jgi:hypothetical protein
MSRLALLLCAVFLISSVAAEDSTNQTRKYFDPIKSSSTMVSMSMILSGFSFAAVILILRSQISGELKESPEFELIYNYLPISFLSAFWGFLVTAIIFFLINGEIILVPFTVSEEIIGTICFSISLVCLFMGISMFSELCLPVEASRFTRILLWIVVCCLTLSMGVTFLDPIMIFDQLEKTNPDISSIFILELAGPAILLIFIAMLLRGLPILFGPTSMLHYYCKAIDANLKNILIFKINFLIFFNTIFFLGILAVSVFVVGIYESDFSRIPVYLQTLLFFVYSIISVSFLISLPIVDATALENKGFALHADGKCNEAINTYDKAIEIDPKIAAVWYKKGIALDDLAKYNDAIKAFDEAIRLDPNYEEAWYGKGIALRALGKSIEANNCLCQG